jgi:hypothetical protein
MEHTLLINEAFALRQRNGIPVYTQIQTKKEPYSEAEINNILDNLNKKRRE